MIQKWNQNPSKIIPNSMRKNRQKKRYQTKARSNARNPQTQSFQKTSFGVRCEENTRRKLTKGWVQSGVQKVKCKGKVKKGRCRQVQKGKCRQGTHYARKHARWPATTCGSLTRIPPGQGLGLLRSPTSTKTEQKWDPNRPRTGPIWPSGGGKGQPKINTNINKYKKRKRKEPK